MQVHRKFPVAAAIAAVVPLALGSGPAGASNPRSAGDRAAAVALDWQRQAVTSIYVTAAKSPPSGSLYLAFTSQAVYQAARKAMTHRASPAAAVASAAHDVLTTYFPAQASTLDAKLVESLDAIADGAAEERGAAIGAAAAHNMIASRSGDGRDDPTIVYNKPAGIGVWQPAPGGAMADAWLGFVDPLVATTVPLDGPDPVTSPAYAADFNEVRAFGASQIAPEQAATANFFAFNPVRMYRESLLEHLDQEPMGLLPTTRLFARLDTATADGFIQAWRLKFDVGFWRPGPGIAAAAIDGNPATEPLPGWAPVLAVPAYPDYVSGHAQATSTFAEVLRLTFGDDLTLTLNRPGASRTYTSLSTLEHDALNSRIWGGLHFRDAMEDGYALGHAVADQVVTAIR